MTSEGSKETQATTEPSESGEQSDPRDSEDLRSSKDTSGDAASREPLRGSEQSSGEQSDPRDSESEGSEEPQATMGPSESETRSADRSGDDIPLNIAGHDDRQRPADRSDDDGTVLEFAEGAAESSIGSEPDDGEDEEVEPVELLVQLAKNGEIDPWDIDVVHVTDAFLDALDEADLRTSGRALFYASVLLRMKSDALFAPDEPEDEELPPWETPFADEGPIDGGDDDGPPGFDPVESLEAEMDRRLERKQARGKPETLDELVRELRDAERGSWWKQSRSYDTSDSPQGYDRGVQELQYHADDDVRVDAEPTSDDVTHTTHEADIETVIENVEAALVSQYENGREEVLYAEIADTGGSRVMTYLALLFLAHRGRVRLDQDELFGDLWVQDGTIDADATEAIAD